jgi:acetylornithine deacetylase/succinyl-diaminopimelate desuccinylase-like protein
MSTCPGSPANSFFDAQAWVASQLTAMGYTVQYHTSTLNGGVSNLYVTKVGAVNPGQMYIVSAHLDGRGGGAAYDDDGSGSALLLMAAEVFAGSDVETDTSVRFIWWDKEEAGLINQRVKVALGRLDPRERFIIEQRVMNERPMTLKELGEHFGFSRERARQLEIRAKDKLKNELAALMAEVDPESLMTAV